MNRFRLTIEASASYATNAPTLEILVGGAVVSAALIDEQTGSGTDVFNFILDFIGDYPSSLSFRFNDGFGEPRSISLERVAVNGQTIDPGDLSAIMLVQGESAAVAVAANDHFFGRIEPVPADLDSPVTGTGGNDRLRGKDDPDAIAGGAGNDIIQGGDNDDILLGETGDDTLLGGNGDDALFGGDDNDVLVGGAGNDLLNGGAGNDRLMGDSGDDIIYGEGGNDTILAHAGNDSIYGDDGNDIIMAGAGNDTVYGGAGMDMIDGGADDDTIDGGDDADQITAGTGNDTVYGGAGADMISGGDGNDTLHGGDDNDIITGDDGDDVINGDGGADSILGGAGADTINGGDGNDTLHGHALDIAAMSAILRANPGTVFSMETGSFYRYVNTAVNYDTAKSTAESTTLSGVAGHLAVITSASENTFVQGILTGNAWLAGVSTGASNDVWRWDGGTESGMAYWNGYAGGNTVNGLFANWDAGQPQDNAELWTVMYANGTWHDWPDSSTHQYVIEWEGGLFSDDSAADTINGGNGNDFIYGYGGADMLNGDAGNDILYGGAGDDTLDGGANDDIIVGGDGSDTLYGGDDNDTLYAAGVATDTPGLSAVTLVDADFTGSTAGATYRDGTFGSNGWSNNYASGSYLGTDGGDANGSARILLGGINNNTITNMSGSWDIDFTAAQDITGATLTFSYRALHPDTFENNEDLFVYVSIDGVEYGLGGNDYVARYDDPADPNDSGWVDVTLSIGALGAGNHRLSIGGLLERKNVTNEQADLRIDDVNLTGNVYSPLTGMGDSASVNSLSGGEGSDTLFGSEGADTLDGGNGNDTIYSGSSISASLAAVMASNPEAILQMDGTIVHTYAATGGHTFTAPTGVTAVDYLVVGGGGGGGGIQNTNSGGGGGGGGGAVLQADDYAVTAGNTYNITVGAGGAGGTGGVSQGGTGGASSFDGNTANGGGGGATTGVNNNGNGGANGGGGRMTGAGANGTQGNDGGDGSGGTVATAAAGGGGGAGGDGSNGNGNNGGAGGAGAASDITGQTVYYGAGGGGGAYIGGGTGGQGGSGTGGSAPDVRGAGGDGIDGTGGGGGGATGSASGSAFTGGDGGDGVVVITYQMDAVNYTVLAGGAGTDALYGADGMDIFTFSHTGAADADTVYGFNRQIDKIDISDLLSGYDPVTESINDFIQITDAGGHSELRVDSAGTGNFGAAAIVATLADVTGLTDEAALASAGVLITA